MSDEKILAIVAVISLFIFLGIPLIAVFYFDIVKFFKNRVLDFKSILQYPFTIYKKNKQMNCHHTWRKKDGDYSYSRVEYRYRCEHCKLDKYLSGKSAEQFEKDFGSDIFDLR